MVRKTCFLYIFLGYVYRPNLIASVHYRFWNVLFKSYCWILYATTTYKMIIIQNTVYFLNNSSFSITLLLFHQGTTNNVDIFTIWLLVLSHECSLLQVCFIVRLWCFNICLIIFIVYFCAIRKKLLNNNL